MNQCLSKSLRIRRGKEIQEILIKGQKYIGNHLILYCASTLTPELPTRAGFLAPKRIGNAVKRNRARRWMREAFRKHRSELKGSSQLLMMGRTSAVHAGYQAVHDDFLRLCRKARLLSET
jgi:ribonuclease P protein component